jgi:Protein of unknown function (DUF3300)
MKLRLFAAVVTIVGLFLGPLPVDSLFAQAPPADNSAPLLSESDLEQLVAPIALYPDPLVALILQASTVPTDIVLADRYVQNGGDPNAIDSQSWDDSVKGLARYPDTLKMMDDNLDWTNQLGAAVLAQQPDVMTAIQAQRAKAESLGNLETTAQQQVVTDQGAIQILPADPQVIYVPVYDPQVVYVQQAPAVPFITFGIGLAVGAWLSGDCDWHNHGIYRGGYYRPGYGWGNNVNININNNGNVWRPNPNKPRPRPPYQPGRPGGGGGNGHLPGWRPPPGNGNGGNRPGGPGNRPGGPNKPGITPLPGGGNSGGNRPGGPGAGPGNGGNRPGKPGSGNGNGNNRPGSPGHRPETPNKPAITPKPGAGSGHTRPAPGTTHPGTTRPGFDKDRPSTKRPTHTEQPKPQVQRPARPQVQPNRPAPQPKPAAQRPATRPAAQPHGNFNRQQPNTKQAPSHSAPARAARPAAPAGGERKRG